MYPSRNASRRQNRDFRARRGPNTAHRPHTHKGHAGAGLARRELRSPATAYLGAACLQLKINRNHFSGCQTAQMFCLPTTREISTASGDVNLRHGYEKTGCALFAPPEELTTCTGSANGTRQKVWWRHLSLGHENRVAPPASLFPERPQPSHREVYVFKLHTMAEPSDTTLTFFTKATPSQWSYVLSLYKEVLKQKAALRTKKGGPEELIKLDAWQVEKNFFIRFPPSLSRWCREKNASTKAVRVAEKAVLCW
ncbi:hypothetical protein HPB49_012551 [Dermacentor silvarum]|uniref:Uncharacterized protein n=1 Tax=Dermacentor silvarum TaxID=543639 RepID=A0ACB8CRE9_DERSI|nr:hypothetical protein HPB49_012551 [Dermacentor silvarum]